MAKQSVEAITDDDLDAARSALAEGTARLTHLKESFYNGDGVEWSAVKSQEGVVEYAEAEIERLARAKARYEEQVRQVELSRIRGEMDAHATAEGERRVEALEAVESAVLAFARDYAADNAKFADWRARMAAAGVKPIGNRFSAAEGDQGLSYADPGGVRAGLREFNAEYSGQVLQELLHSLIGTDGIGREYFTAENAGYPTHDELFARVGTVSQELPGIPDDAIFYKHENGSVHMRDTAHAWPVEDLKRLGLKQISRDEAITE